MHIATIPDRLAPGAEDSDIAGFMDALARANYTGRVSIEGNVPADVDVLTTARKIMIGDEKEQ